jgi:phosphoenolpyruvate-protein kinase (PTS system EI component)
VTAAAGQGASPGRARGPVVRLERHRGRRIPDPVDALAAVADELTALAARVGGDAAGILEAQAAMARDPEIARSVGAAAGPAREAIAAAFAPFRAALARAGSDYQRSRVDDIDEIVRRAQAALDGRGAAARNPPVAGILVADSLSPADTASIPAGDLLGIVSRDGSSVSHAAILARSLGIPAVVAAGAAVDGLRPGDWVAIDGDSGAIGPVAPGERTAHSTRPDAALADAGRAHTSDGQSIEIRANVGSVAEAQAARAAGLEASGLVRTEFLFAGRDKPPSVDEQADVYGRILAALPGEVVVRALDAGSDKPLAYLPGEPGPNPALGTRGIRLLLRQPELLADQLRALCRCGAADRLRVMLPMVARVEELAAARRVADRVFAAEGTRLAIGAMIEVPAAALGVAELAREADFFSLGTNDLLQYLLASDRGAAQWSGDDALPAGVWRLIAGVFDQAAAAGRPVGVCGELAADPEAAGVLCALGASSLSVGVAQAGPLAAGLARRSAAEWHALAAHRTRDLA